VARGERDWRKAAIRRFLVPLAIVAIGIGVVATTSGTARIVGWGIVCLAITVAISLVFLEVGYSEDRARAREQQHRERP
jgi:hypothetical protein